MKISPLRRMFQRWESTFKDFDIEFELNEQQYKVIIKSKGSASDNAINNYIKRLKHEGYEVVTTF